MTKSFSKQHSFLRNINSAIVALFPPSCFILPGSTSNRSGQCYKSALISTMMGTELIYSRWTRIMKSFSFLSMVCAASSLLIHFSVWPFKLTSCSLLRLFKDKYLSPTVRSSSRIPLECWSNRMGLSASQGWVGEGGCCKEEEGRSETNTFRKMSPFIHFLILFGLRV